VASAFSKPSGVLSCLDLVAPITYDEGQPMAAGHLSLSHGVGAIYWVGSMQAARGRSLRLAISRALTNVAFRRGAGARTLQSTAMAEQMYRQIGYE
jgi:hypothetical protein